MSRSSFFPSEKTKYWASQMYRIYTTLGLSHKDIFRYDNWLYYEDKIDSILKTIGCKAAIYCRQSIRDSKHWLPFGQLQWNRKNNRVWCSKYLEDVSLRSS